MTIIKQSSTLLFRIPGPRPQLSPAPHLSMHGISLLFSLTKPMKCEFQFCPRFKVANPDRKGLSGLQFTDLPVFWSSCPMDITNLTLSQESNKVFATVGKWYVEQPGNYIQATWQLKVREVRGNNLGHLKVPCEVYQEFNDFQKLSLT